MRPIGKKIWVIPEGYLPKNALSYGRRFISHETACIINPNSSDAKINIHIYYKDRDPVGPYKITVPAMRIFHLRFNELSDPQPIPEDTDYSSIFYSNQPIVVQHTRLDSRRDDIALLSSIAYGE